MPIETATYSPVLPHEDTDLELHQYLQGREMDVLARIRLNRSTVHSVVLLVIFFLRAGRGVAPVHNDPADPAQGHRHRRGRQ
jgi:hypothetical protein